jgi:hypothetical protein
MQIFLLALSMICSVVACAISIMTYCKVQQISSSVPDKQAYEATTKPVVKESSKVDANDKWANLKNAFKLSGNTNGRSRTS